MEPRRTRIKDTYEDRSGIVHTILLPEDDLSKEDLRQIYRITGINMYKCFGRTDFELSASDLEIAKSLRYKYIERFKK